MQSDLDIRCISFCLYMLTFSFLCAWPARFAGAQVPVIVGYVFPQNNILGPGEVAGQKLTRIDYAFANVEAGRIVNGYAQDDLNLATLVGLKKQNPSLTVMVSVGGWLWSGIFSDLALTKESRATFIDSVAAYLDRHQLDGLDIDWEYPGLPGYETHFRAEDKQNYTLLLKELRVRFNGLEKHLHRRLYLTVAAGASSEFLAHTEMKEAQKYLDTINLMAYDYYQASDGVAGHHAPLFTNPADPKKISGDRSVLEFEQAGVPAAKIVLGVPFYGRTWGAVPATNHGLYQPGTVTTPSYAPYGLGPDELLKAGYVRYWDSVASAPYLYNAEKQIFVSYDDPQSLALKCNYVLSHKLGGVMFWDYEDDPAGVLLDALNAGLHKAVKK